MIMTRGRRIQVHDVLIVTRSIVLYVVCFRSLFVFLSFSFGHCVVCHSSVYGFRLPLWYLQTLLTGNTTGVTNGTETRYLFGESVYIRYFDGFVLLQFSMQCLYFPFSFGHCIVCSLITPLVSVRIALVFYVVFIFSFFFWPLHCLFSDYSFVICSYCFSFLCSV